jgi:hypothetical protein
LVIDAEAGVAMKDEKEMRVGRLIFEEIAVDETYMRYLKDVKRSGGARYKPGKASSEKATTERPKAGKPRKPEQLKLDLSARGHAETPSRLALRMQDAATCSF